MCAPDRPRAKSREPDKKYLSGSRLSAPCPALGSRLCRSLLAHFGHHLLREVGVAVDVLHVVVVVEGFHEVHDFLAGLGILAARDDLLDVRIEVVKACLLYTSPSPRD